MDLFNDSFVVDRYYFFKLNFFEKFPTQQLPLQFRKLFKSPEWNFKKPVA